MKALAEFSRGLMIAVATIAIVFLLCSLVGCTASGEFDSKAFETITRTGFEVYDRHHGYSPRGEMPVAYPVYR